MPEQPYRRIFELVSDALLLYEMSGRPLAFNPAACSLFGYSQEEMHQVHTGQLIHPSSRANFASFGDTLLLGHDFQCRGTFLRKDGSTFTAEVRGTPFPEGGTIHALAILRDVSQEVEDRHQLDQQLVEQTRQLEALLEVSRNVASTLEIRPLLRLIIQQIGLLIEFNSAGIFLIDGDEYYAAEYQGLGRIEGVLKQRVSRRRLSTISEVERLGRPVIIGDYWTDDPEAEPLAWAVREDALPDEIATSPHPHYRSWLGVPLMVKERFVGVLRLDHMEPDRFSERDAQLAMAMAGQAAIAIENARLYEAELRRAEQFRTISEVGQRITSILDLDELLSQTVRLIKDTFGFYHVHIGLVEETRVVFAPRAGVWQDDDHCSYCNFPIPVGEVGLCGRVAANGIPILSPDVGRDDRFIPVITGQTGSSLVLPIAIKGHVIGVLNVESEQRNAFDNDDLLVLQLLANQLANAIENARLYEQAQALAALQERQKLARELHDSVSQALYGIALGARTAREQLDRDPAKAVEPLEYVLSLTEAGMAEMRALIFELRPESLANEGLRAALVKQAAAVKARHLLQVDTAIGEEPKVSLEVKQALLRVAQEALHNVVKHARAGRVHLNLQQTDGRLVVAVSDDGIGFDIQSAFPGHLGLHSMRERLERLGGQLQITSQPGSGTTVTASIPVTPGTN